MPRVDTSVRGKAGSIGAVLAAALLVWSVFSFSVDQLKYAQKRGNQLTELFDSYSEANGIRAGEGYADNGFSSNKGLPEVGYGHAFEYQGGKHDRNLCDTPEHCVYLHYPPGPDLVLGAMTKMCGKNEVACLRFAPLSVGFVCLAFFAWAAAAALGVRRAALVVYSFAFAPMLTNAMHYLHYHSYVTSLLFAELGVLLVALLAPKRPTWVYAAWLGVIGFAFGWCSFDYAFHVALAALPVWLMTPEPRASWRRAALFTAAACAGYFVANVLHFWQVAEYLGSARAAYDDFAHRAAARTHGQIGGLGAEPLLKVLLSYWTILLAEPHFLGFNFLAASAAVTVLLLPKAPLRFTAFGHKLAWAPRPGFKWAFWGAFGISNAWLVVMRQHATIHGHFLPRNFAISYVVGALVLAASLRSDEDVADVATAASTGSDEDSADADVAAASPEVPPEA
jgi:hypothetical protein